MITISSSLSLCPRCEDNPACKWYTYDNRYVTTSTYENRWVTT